MDDTPQPPDVYPLVVDTRGVARLLGISPRTVRALNCSGRLPRSLSLGRRRLWCLRELEDWIEAGAPGRERWEARKVGRPPHTGRSSLQRTARAGGIDSRPGVEQDPKRGPTP